METRNIHEYAGWYASYMYGQEQGEALIRCQTKKIKQLKELIEKISGEIELTEKPKECGERPVLESIKALIKQVNEVEHTTGYFKWFG